LLYSAPTKICGIKEKSNIRSILGHNKREVV
jgi:hypothetical protein